MFVSRRVLWTFPIPPPPCQQYSYIGTAGGQRKKQATTRKRQQNKKVPCPYIRDSTITFLSWSFDSGDSLILFGSLAGTAFEMFENMISQAFVMFESLQAMNSVHRIVWAIVIATLLSLHGLKKKSLSLSGAMAAFFVGFCSFAVGVRFGVILILFYFTGSQLTKMGKVRKAQLEEDYTVGGQRSWIQVFACSILATVCALLYLYFVGEDCCLDFGETSTWTGNAIGNVEFFGLVISKKRLGSYLWALYISHYACATADTWASEIGVLAMEKPTLITSLLFFRPKKVPHGTNGAISLLGTMASIIGGTFIGLVFFLLSYVLEITTMYGPIRNPDQTGIILFGAFSGFLGSTIDSLLGCTVQATYYSNEKKCIVKKKPGVRPDESIVIVCGNDFLSNEGVNLLSTLLTMIIATALAPYIMCLCDALHCSGGWGARISAIKLDSVPLPSPIWRK